MGKSRQNRSKAETSVFPFQTSERVEYTKTPLSSKCQSGAKKVIERNKWRQKNQTPNKGHINKINTNHFKGKKKKNKLNHRTKCMGIISKINLL